MKIYTDKKHRIAYSTDASAYRVKPKAVCFPRNKEDILELISNIKKHNSYIIPRAAGTSLAGQVVGNGYVADISRHLNKIIELNTAEKWVRVEPGVILEELNNYLAGYGLFFGPETSTANRCCIGGMVGNNSCGLHSVKYGATRDHCLAVEMILSDGNIVLFEELNKVSVGEKMAQDNLEGNIYRKVIEILTNKSIAEKIKNEFPEPDVKRRNTAYAIDELDINKINLSKLICGSEGTLGFITEIKLSLCALSPKHKALVCYHCKSLEEAFNANLIALKHPVSAVELMDKTILDLSKNNIEQNKNRFFIKDNPEAILIIELNHENLDDLNNQILELKIDLSKNNYTGYSSVVYNEKTKSVWNLRKAGLGLLSSMDGDSKPVSVIEDTAVSPKRLPAYMKDFQKLLSEYKLNCVYHAHIGSGELHLRPILNLKNSKDKELFREIAHKTAKLVKKHKGSLSGEHGDGRLRGEFIPLVLGKEIYDIIKQIKYTFDPDNIFNQHNIIDTDAMNSNLRYDGDYKSPEIETYFNYRAQKNWLTAIEQCNGSGDCRKKTNGTMCPSFKATGDELNSTRARANMLRELISKPYDENIFNQKEIKEVLDLCLSCKACKSECPSNVDLTRFKAEFMQHYYDNNKIGIRVLSIINLAKIQTFFSKIPGLYNWAANNLITSKLIKKVLGFATERKLPLLSKICLKKYVKENENIHSDKIVYLLADEFSSYTETEIGIHLVDVLNKLNYRVIIPKHFETGRTSLSKGLVKKAKKLANKNVEALSNIISDKTPLIGIEPSCILSFRDEYPDLVDPELQQDSINLAKNCLLYDEFFIKEINEDKIDISKLKHSRCKVYIHGHCHQKSLASVKHSVDLLKLCNYDVREIPSGCCGMAGSFGFEKEHYELSQQIGELVLFPYVRNSEKDSIICAPGTSCRQQIHEATNRKVFHPIELL
ncbi:MAG: FAD-binding protein [Marinifilaceae bacterium]|jgi:FAD/FMN-containing dehydrogenase/Fe-S oxidoreductase|nr:FAD-binding protein [Marinifilaceae bacterium]